MKAMKKNRIVSIQDHKKDEYLKMGYTITDDNGKVIAEPEAATLDEAKKQIAKLEKQIADKDAKIKKLEAQAKADKEGTAAKATTTSKRSSAAKTAK